MKYLETYKLNKNIDAKTLYKNGFKNGTFKCNVYRNLIQLLIRIDNENNNWEYQIYDIDSESLYTPYYSREYGSSDVVKKIDSKVDRIFKDFEKKNIFKKRGKANGKKNR